MTTKFKSSALALTALLLAQSCSTSPAMEQATADAEPQKTDCSPLQMGSDASWIERSNQHVSETIFPIMAKYGPEYAASLGIDGLDEEIAPFGPGVYEENLEAYAQVVAELECRLALEQDRRVKQDLQILVQSGKDSIRSSQMNYNFSFPYINLTQSVFWGVRGLLDKQVAPERYPAALVRIKKYAGLEPGYTPRVESAKALFYDRIGKNPDLVGPYGPQVEQDLERAEQFLAGIPQMFESYNIQGWEEPWAEMEKQLREYNEWVRQEILPRSRDSFLLPRELYEDSLHQWGVYWTPEELISRAGLAARDIRAEMDALAPLVAAERGWSTDLSTEEVVRRLIDEQIPPDQILEAYNDTLGKIETQLRKHKVISIPERPAGIRIATEAETAAQPAPHLETPRLVGNTGEYPYFVLPFLQADENGNVAKSDDLAYATTWTLTAHEARPGHEMQFSSMIENGVSTVRTVFAFNSANVEGWALYAEGITKPYMPLDGQLISLQNRLVRAYRMLLDPMLNLGQISPEEAKKVLMEKSMVLENWAQNEIERYTYRIPGQATAYYYGYSHLQSIRARAEIALGDKFDQQAFHDFILNQGLLPVAVLDKAIMEDFVPSQM